MFALGHKQTFAVQNGMSALPPIADMCGAVAYVCFVPIADISLFHHLGQSELPRQPQIVNSTHVVHLAVAFALGNLDPQVGQRNVGAVKVRSRLDAPGRKPPPFLS